MMKIKVDGTAAEFLSSWFHYPLDEPERTTFSVYYTNYIRSFTPRMREHFSRNTKEVMDLIAAAKTPLRVLEVGAGTGTECLWMALNGASVLGVDIQNDRLSTARKRQEVLEKQLGKPLECEFKKMNILEAEGSAFDILWIEQAFHHMEPREEVLKKLSTLVISGGHIVFQEANALSPLLQILLFMRRGFKTIRTYKDDMGQEHMYGDERILTSKRLSKHLEENGFKIIQTNYYRIFPSSAKFDSLSFLENKLPKFFKFMFTHYNLVARKL